MTILYTFLFFIFGTLFASFAFVLAERLPEKSTLMGRSRCEVCGHSLRLVDVLPFLGYLFNLGRCHYCKAKIPFIHVVIEATGGALFVLAYLSIGFEMELIAVLLMLFVLGVEALADARKQIVIDRVWVVGIVPLIGLRVYQGLFLPHLLSSAILFTAMFVIALIGHAVYKKEALGGGDVKLYLFIGFCVTWDRGLLSLLLASCAGFLYGVLRKRSKKREIPLVPFIFIGVVIAYFWGADLIAWYLNLLGV